MRYAVIRENHVVNIMVAAESQRGELEAALGTALTDAAPLGLMVGDFFNGAEWTRNLSGEQVPLPLGDNPAVEAALNALRGATDVD